MVLKKSKKNAVKKKTAKRKVSGKKLSLKKSKSRLKGRSLKKKNAKTKIKRSNKKTAKITKKTTSRISKSSKKKSFSKVKKKTLKPISKIKKKIHSAHDSVKLTRKGANRPTLLFLDCEDAKLKKIVYRLKRTNWVRHVHILSGISRHRIALYTNIGNSQTFEKHMSYLQAMDGIHSVFEYPAFKHATNGVKMGQYPYSAYFFLKCEDEMNDLWEEFKHSENLVEMHEVPGEYDFIMYTEGKSYDILMDKWSDLCNTHKLKEIDAAFTVSESLIK